MSGEFSRPFRSVVDGDTHFGAPRSWARDLALVGGLTCLIVPSIAFPLTSRWLFALCATLAGIASGATLGAFVPRLFHPFVRRVPVLLLLGAGFGIGSVWGAMAGFVASLITGANLVLSISAAALAGGLQFGWFWLPYALRQNVSRPVWPVIFGAAVMSLFIGLALASLWRF